MEYAMYAVQTDDGKYTEADTVPDLITENVEIARHLIMTAIRDRMYSLVDLIISEGDVKRFALDAAEELIYYALGEPENRLMKKVEYGGFTLFGIPEGPMPGETQLCLQCKWRGTDVCKMTPIVEIDEIRKLECRHFESTDRTGFYLNYHDEDDRIYLGINPEEVAEKLELDYEDEALEACKEWVDDYYDHDELVEMVANGDTPKDPVFEMVRRMFEHFSENASNMGSSYGRETTYGVLTFILLEDRTGVELSAPRTVLYHKYRVACEENDTPAEEVLTYNDLVFSEGLWLHPELIKEFASRLSYGGWLDAYNKLQPEIAQAINRQ